MSSKKTFIVLLLLMVLIGNVSAYVPSVEEGVDALVNNDLLQFAFIFAIFAALIFYASNRAFKDNKGIAVAISVAVSFLVTSAIVREGFLYGHLGVSEEITAFVLVFGVLVASFVILKVFYTNLGRVPTVLILFFIWVVLFFLDLDETAFPYGSLYDYFFLVYNWFASFVGLIAIVIISLFILFWKKKKVKIGIEGLNLGNYN